MLNDENCGLEPRIDVAFGQHVDRVGPGGIGADKELLGDHVIVESPRQQGAISYKKEGIYPEVLAGRQTAFSPEAFAGPPIEATYRKIAPNPDD